MQNEERAKKRRRRRTGLLTLVMAAMLSLLAVCTAAAQGAIDMNAKVSLTLHYKNSGKAIEGATFRLYRAASVSQDLTFTPEEAFKPYAVSWKPENSGDWKSLAETLSGYVKKDKLTAVREGKTDANGDLVFSGDDLKVGLYLVLGDRRTVGRYTYTPEPFLVSIPGYGEDNTWEYTPEVLPKASSSYDPPGGGGDGDSDTVTRKALKVWRDGEGESTRPASVTVQLLRNGSVYATAELNASNNWSQEWRGLSDKYTWEVVEKEVPTGYTVRTSLEGITFVVTNTKGDPDNPGGENPPERPGTPPTPMSGRPPESGSDTPEPATGRGKLPQTGVLWWPVPLMAGAGLLLFGAGWYQKRKKDE